jgi:gamma-glutamyl hercynylcysteine S-oxide synthase
LLSPVFTIADRLPPYMTLPDSDDPALLAAELSATRARSTRLTHDLRGEQLFGPRLAIVNPPLWELGHLAWFQEYWCLRYRDADAPAASMLAQADSLYDSAKVAHDTRWDLPLPALETTRGYQSDVLERVLHRLQREPENSALQYFVRLAIFHEDMHAEAFHYTRQTLGYADPFAAAGAAAGAARATQRGAGADAELGGGTFALGAYPHDGFVFDNEKWSHEIHVAPFRIARTAVANAEYLDFVAAGGYLRREWWSEEGWAWREAAQLHAPRDWIKHDNSWRLRRFDRTVVLPPEYPVVHVNWHEAQAYCSFAGRRLPTEAEWEYAAAADSSAPRKRRYPWGNALPTAARANLESSGVVDVSAYADGDSACGCRQMMGNVWEWTASTFGPYPGFVADPYKEYSQPWFGTQKVLRGGSFATTRRLIRNTWRNFYTPERNDIFAGFRTCAID